MVNSFVDWCELNHLQFNINKTNDLYIFVLDFRKSKSPVTTLPIQAQSRLKFLKMLRSFNLCSTMLQMFYESEP